MNDPPAGPAGWGPPAPAPWGRPVPVRRHPQATTVLVLGVLGFVLAPILLSIPAWVMGSRARRDLRADPGLDGATEITIGWLLGIVGTLLTLLVLLFIGAVFLILGGALFGIDQAVQDLPTTTPGVLGTR